ncbi:MAG: hypothetical protein DDT31_01569 [Syntrophomonadaceae bacterium]|nr:hypothetical protein [Bacillota bacterium]
MKEEKCKYAKYVLLNLGLDLMISQKPLRQMKNSMNIWKMFMEYLLNEKAKLKNRLRQDVQEKGLWLIESSVNV